MKKTEFYGLSDVGLVRAENEDAFLVQSFKDLDLLLVADGMGGHVGGRVASSLAVEVINGYLKANHGRLSVPELIGDAMTLAHRRIQERRIQNPALAGMGTTCTLALLQPDRARRGGLKVTMGHIGDSRLYQLDASDIRQLSTDHTMLQRLLDAGALKPEEARDYAYKNVIYKSLGGETARLELDQPCSFQLAPGQALLLCSDGLSGYLSPEEMQRIFLGASSLKAAAAYMVNLAKHRGGNDNITVVLAACGRRPRRRDIVLEKLPALRNTVEFPSVSGRPPRRGLLAFLLSLLVMLVALLLYLLMDQHLGTRPPAGNAGAQADTIRPAAPEPVAPLPQAEAQAEEKENNVHSEVEDE